MNSIGEEDDAHETTLEQLGDSRLGGSAMALAQGIKLGPYEILSALGAGGMGEVYRARDTRLGRDVAVKVLPPEFSADPERLKRFEREARATAALDHPNILAIHDIGTHEGTPYIVEQLLEGESLRARLDVGALPLREALEIGAQIAKGLAAAHARNIIHRDLKPENVFITADGVVKILDFGLAKLAEPVLDTKADTLTSAPPSTTEAGHVLGTVAYMAPEQARGLKVDQRADMFALGVVLYEMLSGERPFRGQTHTDVIAAILKEEPPPLGENLPSGLEAIVFRCLEKRPEDRLSSARDLALALEALSPSSAPRRAADPATTSQQRAEHERVRILHLPKRRTVVVGVSLSLAVLAVAGAWVVRRWRQVAWARNKALPDLVRLADAHEYWPAFLLARKIEAIVPDDATLQKLRPRFTGKLEREIRPAGAKVLARPRTGGEADWVELGEARGKPLQAPLGHSIFKVQSQGLEPREFAMTVFEFTFGGTHSLGNVLALGRRGEVPDGMVRVDNTTKDPWLGLDASLFDFAQIQQMAPFFVDTHEVTNREYKRFVDAGGYQKREYWKEPFERDGTALRWDEAMALFRDTTGRPGPATWEVGTFPNGRDDFPVTGTSWYEAAAYAAFTGKRLPSVYHWALASALPVGGAFLPASNFSGKLAPVRSYGGGLNVWGLYDVAGNAREWCTNATGNERFALGGAADGPAYMLWTAVTKPPFDRSPMSGFRCIKPVALDPQQAQLDRPVARKAMIDWSKEKGFSDDAWKSWQGLLSYTKVPPDSRTEWTDDTLPTWRMEKVSFTAAYSNERVVAYLFLPRNVPPPWQAVIFWPGGYAAMVSSSQDGRDTLDQSFWDYLVKDGRAVVYPILKDTFERGGRPDNVDDSSLSNSIPLVKDVFRTIDYLETRTDIRNDRIGYLGLSWGAGAGPMVCSFERRIKAAVFQGAALVDKESLGFGQHCSTPIQMINGRFDGFGETHSPLFRMLGTPADRKRHIVFDADHSLAGFEKDVIKVNLEWFDRYLGPVRGAVK